MKAVNNLIYKILITVCSQISKHMPQYNQKNQNSLYIVKMIVPLFIYHIRTVIRHLYHLSHLPANRKCIPHFLYFILPESPPVPVFAADSAYSDRSAETGSIVEAFLDGIRPPIRVRTTLNTTSMTL